MGLAGNGEGSTPHEKVGIGMSGFHSSSKQKEGFTNDGGKKPEEGRFGEIKPCLVGRERKRQPASSHSLVDLDVNPKEPLPQ